MLMNWAKYTVSPTRRLSKGADTSPQLKQTNKQIYQPPLKADERIFVY